MYMISVDKTALEAQKSGYTRRLAAARLPRRGNKMNETQYKNFVEQASSGALLIGIDRVVARKFYTDIPLSKIEQQTGEAPYFEKMVIWFAFLAAPLALLTGCVLSVFAFHWWAALVIPVSVVAYLGFSGQSSTAQVGMIGVTILVCIAVASLFTNFFVSPFASWYFISVTFSLWSSRLLYCLATVFLRAFVLRNQRALEFLGEHIHIKEAK